jgi:hypothetical protein
MFGVFVCWSVTFVLVHKGTQAECEAFMARVCQSIHPDSVRVNPL